MTPSPAPELLDVYDSLGRHRGVKDRRAVHRDGDWHRVFHCLVVARRPERGPVAVLQRRGATKHSFPGKLDLSATGHLAAGERPEEGTRELAEELGLTVTPDRLVAVGVRRVVDDGGEGNLNRELAHVFLVTDDRPLVEYEPGRGEVDGVYDVPLAEGLRLLADPGHRTTVHGAEWEGDDLGAVERVITRSDLVPGDDYWVVLFVMAERYLAGARPLGI